MEISEANAPLFLLYYSVLDAIKFQPLKVKRTINLLQFKVSWLALFRIKAGLRL